MAEIENFEDSDNPSENREINLFKRRRTFAPSELTLPINQPEVKENGPEVTKQPIKQRSASEINSEIPQTRRSSRTKKPTQKYNPVKNII